MDADDFQTYLRRRGMSQSTAALYARMARAFDARCRRLGTTAAAIDLPELDELVAQIPRTRSSRQQLRSVLGHLWAFHGRSGPLDAIEVPSKPRMRSRALDEGPALHLERMARLSGYPEGTAVLLGLYGALRRTEIATLRWSSLADGWLHFVGKGSVSASIPLHPVPLAALLAVERRGEYVFPGLRDQGHVSPTTIWLWTKHVGERAGLVVTTHQLRHTALTTALDRTHDLRAVQELARHARPETTAGYTRVNARRLTAIVAAIDYEAAAAEAEDVA